MWKSNLSKYLSKLSKKHNFKFIQISTDAFYLGRKFKLNRETDKLFAINNYAKTKLLAEKFVNKNRKSLIIRTNFTGREFKKDSKRFIDWIYRTIRKKNKIKLFHDMYISTIDVKTCAKTVIDLVLTNASGIYNLGTKDAVSKMEFAIKFSKKINKKLKYQGISCDDNTQTPRNKNLGLNVSKIEKKLNWKMINSNQAISNLAKEY